MYAITRCLRGTIFLNKNPFHPYQKIISQGFIIFCLILEARAFWILPCRQRLSLGRIDPIVSPGFISAHVHTIHGGNAFSAIVSNDGLRTSECSSCSVKQDKSAYWTPSMYWENPEHQFIALNQTGGMQVSYHLRGQSIVPFPQDFRIIAGNSSLRNFSGAEDGIEKSDYVITGLSANQDYLRQKAIAFTCLNYSAPPEPALAIHALPQRRRCPNGLRAEIMFPSCWNGNDSDSHDHRSHVKYPSTVDDGYCPEGYQYRIPSLFFETIWDIEAVFGKGGRLVFSNGDPTGYGYHGDFMNGWNQTALMKAISQCRDPSGIVDRCPVFEIYTPQQYGTCTKEDEAQLQGPLKILPGCNIVTSGPENAPKGNC